MPKARPQDKFAESVDALAEQAEQVAAGLQVQGRPLSEDEQHTVDVMQIATRSLKEAAAILRGEMDMSTSDNMAAEDPREALAKQIDALRQEMQSATVSLEVQGRALLPDEVQTVDALRSAMDLLQQAAAALRS